LRKEPRSWIYSFKNEAKTLEPALEKKFRVNKKARNFFTGSALSHQKQVIYWIASAKKEETAVRVSKKQ
jgi:uncharacterized protein YdeI (YjbR/CyaY-like superfamily)